MEVMHFSLNNICTTLFISILSSLIYTIQKFEYTFERMARRNVRANHFVFLVGLGQLREGKRRDLMGCSGVISVLYFVWAVGFESL